MITAQIKEPEKVTAEVKQLSLGAGAPKEETDPTVPDWAKQPTKPAYTAAEVGAIPVPSTATVGQTIRVSAVDESGKPTEWEAVDFPEGGGGAEVWETEITTEEDVWVLKIPFPVQKFFDLIIEIVTPSSIAANNTNIILDDGSQWGIQIAHLNTTNFNQNGFCLHGLWIGDRLLCTAYIAGSYSYMWSSTVQNGKLYWLSESSSWDAITIKAGTALPTGTVVRIYAR